MVIDKAMKEEEGHEGEVAGFVEDGFDGRGQLVKRGLLGPRIASVLGTVSHSPQSRTGVVANPTFFSGRVAFGERRADHLKSRAMHDHIHSSVKVLSH